MYTPLFQYTLKESNVMCSRPIERDGNTFACRTCDECISTRRYNWVARAMMEKALHPHCLVLALTYDDTTEHNRDAARMFQYLDVRLFLARLREAIKAAEQPQGVRFLVAGEQGSRNGRCHWHMILYSQADLTQIGEITGLQNNKRVVITDRKEMMTFGKHKRRLNWHMWPHGYVTFQEPDVGGMHYVLSYCLKDQFTVEKSKGTMRQAKAENFATGLFRMSKRPAIGEQFVFNKFADLDKKGAVLPALSFKVPGFYGTYIPSGSFRQKALWALVALNQRAIYTTGRDAPQWSSLLSSCQDNQSDLEILTNVKAQEEETPFEFASRIILASKEVDRQRSIGQAHRKCGRKYPCQDCLARLHHSEVKDRYGLERVIRETPEGANFFYEFPGQPGSSHSDKGRGWNNNPVIGVLHQDCRERSLPDQQRNKIIGYAFPSSFKK